MQYKIGAEQVEKTELFEERKKIIYDLMCDSKYKPLKYKEIVYLLQVPEEDRPELSAILDRLIYEGKIEKKENGRYVKTADELLEGTFISNKKGFGFVRVDGIDYDFFIPANKTRGAFHDDKVLIRPLDESEMYGERRNRRRSGTVKKLSEASVEKILERGLKTVVGVYQKNKKFGFVIPDNSRIDSDIFIPGRFENGAKSGDRVVVELTSYGDKVRSAEGKIIEDIGDYTDPLTDVLSVVRELKIPYEFPEEVTADLKRIPDEVDPRELATRTDLRDLVTVTIDGEDAKDLDDAITLYEENGMYKLGVHIADVSHYVTENSPLDKEALNRGTSCYLVDKVIPMLPEKLSNGICSLNAGKDRLTLSCLMDIDKNGNIVSHKICESVINVNERMTYTAVSAIIEDRDPETMERYSELVPLFDLMLEVSDLLREKRRQRGSIDFDFDESKIVVEDGKVSYIGAYERRRSNGIIEDFMLAANETIAEDYFWQELPFEYRVHESPDAEKVKQLGVLISKFGFYFKASRDNIHPKEFQKLIDSISGSECENLVSRMTLRTMKQAKYSTECTGHFGLACRYYCHFTSPIRRYPDLMIHRIIKENIRGKLNDNRQKHYNAILPKICDDNSKKERRAESAEREVEKLKKVEYMSEHVGEVFQGVISGVNNRGIFVELENTVEGFVSVADMYDDFYCYSEEEYAMIGETGHNKYSIGDKVTVKVAKTDKLTKSIDFVIKMKEGEESHGKGKRRQAHRK